MLKNWNGTHTLLSIFTAVWYVALELQGIPTTNAATTLLVGLDKDVLQIIPVIAMCLGVLTGSAVTAPVILAKKIEEKGESK